MANQKLKQKKQKANQKKDSFIFYRSFYEAVKNLDDKNIVSIFKAIAEKALNGKDTDLDNIEKSLMILITPQLEANNKRYKNGHLGGRPKKGNNQSETNGYENKKPNYNQDVTKPIPNENENENKNVNLNENLNANENILNSPNGELSKPDGLDPPVSINTFKILFRSDQVINFWNDIANKYTLPKIRLLNTTLATKLKKRLTDFKLTFDDFSKQLSEAINQSKFLQGDNDRNWRITLPWLLKVPDNLQKVLDGNYADRAINGNPGWEQRFLERHPDEE